MIYTEFTCKAMKLAYKAHDGQFDVSGVPYIFHPIHLAEQMPDEITTCIALLHDVIEDTKLSLADLDGEFPPEVVEAVRLLTHDPSVPYENYVEKLAQNPLCRIVKKADLEHNSDRSRLVGIDVPQATLEHWNCKYSNARKILDEAERNASL